MTLVLDLQPLALACFRRLALGPIKCADAQELLDKDGRAIPTTAAPSP
jgi:hypothetical protein